MNSEDFLNEHRPCLITQLHSVSDKDSQNEEPKQWRLKEKMRTVSVALVLCLNVGVDPPDAAKPSPCCRLESWLDPLSLPANRAAETIGNHLQKNYERWQQRARFKIAADPTKEDLSKLCTNLRRSAKDERVLLHYNGHGVPRPTANCEVWVFNREYTQYMPLSLYELHSWLESPAIYVYDCSQAGILIEKTRSFPSIEEAACNDFVPDCIQLASCASDQTLPTHKELPADLFTTCLVTPIKTALIWHSLKRYAKNLDEQPITPEMYDKIHGKVADRRTAIGELNWIFTAITDTIAWTTLPLKLFQRLFRQDMLVAGLFRNFLLAERVMRYYGCTPISDPELPPMHSHRMWDAWDHVCDLMLVQMPSFLQNTPDTYSYVNSTFFSDQLKTFEVYLTFPSPQTDPEQLPIVLQVLLSQVHRVTALQLLKRYLDCGRDAVFHALFVGIFPYVLKLLQSSIMELRPLLVSIWAKILSVDGSCQSELIKDSGHIYFLNVLESSNCDLECRTQAVFVLAQIVKNFPLGQKQCINSNLITICMGELLELKEILDINNSEQIQYAKWLIICLGLCWHNNSDSRWNAVRANLIELLLDYLDIHSCQIQAALLYCFGTFIDIQNQSEHADHLDNLIAKRILILHRSPSQTVRRELTLSLMKFVSEFERSFTSCQKSDFQITDCIHGNSNLLNSMNSLQRGYRGKRSHVPIVQPEEHKRSNQTLLEVGSTIALVYHTIVRLSNDPCPNICGDAKKLISEIKSKPIINRERNSKSDCTESPPRYFMHQPISDDSYQLGTPRSRRTFDRGPPSNPSNEGNVSNPGLKSMETADSQFPDSAMRSYLPEFFTQSNFPPSEKIIDARTVWKDAGALQLEECVYSSFSELSLSSNLKFTAENLCLTGTQVLATGKCGHQIAILDYEKPSSQQLNQFYLHEISKDAKISQMAAINEFENSPLLLMGTHEGNIYIYQNILSPLLSDRKDLLSKRSLLCSWRAYSCTNQDHMFTRLCWQQKLHILTTSGDLTSVKHWDVDKEQLMGEMNFLDKDFSQITSLTSVGNLTFVGSESGAVNFIDRREPTVKRFPKEHISPIKGLYANDRFLYTADEDKGVKVWDIGEQRSSFSIPVNNGPFHCFAAHQNSGVMAYASVIRQCAVVFNNSGRILNKIDAFSGFLSQRLGPIASVAFHPHRPLLAVGCDSRSLLLYSTDKALHNGELNLVRL